ncbi:hypothetical protein LJC07_01780 [Christensenellaceae bacterium OttesenSCG-928-L17]|nr:hypothetical protein [Christensenellaceae bacterium OttesenSCG-928-L17]
MKKKFKQLHTTRGSALVWAVMISVVLAIVLATGLTLSTAMNAQEITRKDINRAQYTAHSVVQGIADFIQGATIETIDNHDAYGAQMTEPTDRKSNAYYVYKLLNDSRDANTIIIENLPEEMGTCEVTIAKDETGDYTDAGTEKINIIITATATYHEQTAVVEAVLPYGEPVVEMGEETIIGEDVEWEDMPDPAEQDNEGSGRDAGWYNADYVLSANSGVKSSAYIIANTSGNLFSSADKIVTLTVNGAADHTFFVLVRNSRSWLFFPATNMVIKEFHNTNSSKVYIMNKTGTNALEKSVTFGDGSTAISAQNTVFRVNSGTGLTINTNATLTNCEINSTANVTIKGAVNYSNLFVAGTTTLNGASFTGGNIIVKSGEQLHIPTNTTIQNTRIFVQSGATLTIEGPGGNNTLANANVTGANIYVEDGGELIIQSNAYVKSNIFVAGSGSVALNATGSGMTSFWGDIYLQDDASTVSTNGNGNYSIRKGDTSTCGEGVIHDLSDNGANINIHDKVEASFLPHRCGETIQSEDKIYETWGSPIFREVHSND